MTRISGIAGAFVVALALAPVSADAQQIFACVQNSSGTVRVVPQFVSCGNNESLVSWNVTGPPGPQGPVGPVGPTGMTGPQGPAGQALAERAFACSSQSTVKASQPIPLFDGGQAGFGSSISTTGNPFTNFVLQPGIYQIHLDGIAWVPTPPYTGDGFPLITLTMNSVGQAAWFMAPEAPPSPIVGGGPGMDISGGGTGHLRSLSPTACFNSSRTLDLTW